MCAEAQKLSSQLVVSLVLVLVASGTSATATAGTVILGYDRCTDAFDLLMFLFDLLRISLRVRVEPRLTVFQCIKNLFLFVRIHLLAQTFILTRTLSCRSHRMNVTVERILRIYTLLYLLVFVGELL